MQLNATFDVESSKLSDKIIFSCEEIELTHDDIAELKKKKLISYVEESTLPESIPCQILIFLENGNKARVTLFNNDFVLPSMVFDEPFLNKNLIDRCKSNG